MQHVFDLLLERAGCQLSCGSCPCMELASLVSTIIDLACVELSRALVTQHLMELDMKAGRPSASIFSVVGADGRRNL